jgi:hypothetical protein
MPILNLDDVKAGMTLAEAVRNHQDQLLLEGGRRITEKSIRIFKSWGIRRVAVKSGPAGDDPGDGVAAAGLATAIEEGLGARFGDGLTDPLMVAIMQAAGRQLAARQKKKKKTGDVRS